MLLAEVEVGNIAQSLNGKACQGQTTYP